MTKDIYLKIVEIVESLKGTGEPLAEVYGYPESHPTLFPCVIMDSEGGSSNDISSNSKFITVNVVIRVLLRQRNASEATLQRLDIIDAFFARFYNSDNIDDLDGVADIVDIPTFTTMFIIGTADQPLFGFDIIITAKKVLRAN